MSRPFYQVTYKDPCDVTRFGPRFWLRERAEEAAAELKRIHPQTEVGVTVGWSRDKHDSGD